MAETTIQIEGHSNDDDKWWLALLSIDESDLARADSFWKRHASPQFAGLISHDGFTFNPTIQRYVRTNGRMISDDELYWLILSFITASGDEIESETEKMLAGKISLSDWQGIVGREIKDLNLATAATGAGGIGNLSEQDLLDIRGKAGEGLTDAYARLRRFGDQVKSGEETPKNTVSRSGLYADPAYVAFEEARRAAHLRAKDGDGNPLFTHERNGLDDTAAHCQECPWWTAQGWQPIGTIPPPGTRECHGGCKCRIFYGREIDGEIQEPPASQ